MNYTKRPVTIQAWQLTLNNVSNGIPELFQNDAIKIRSDIASVSAIIHTLEGDMKADHFDYIIRGVNGEFYPCKPDIFEKTYMPDPNIEDYINRMRDLANNRDVEGTHIEADKILCKVLKVLGQSELVEEFEKLEKWYA